LELGASLELGVWDLELVARALSFSKIEIRPMTAQPPRAAGEADFARIAQFNRTEAPFPDNVTLQELIEAQIDKHSLETAVLSDHDKVSAPIAHLQSAQ
jgi:hypothetical protein